jgi:hypothetical protein
MRPRSSIADGSQQFPYDPVRDRRLPRSADLRDFGYRAAADSMRITEVLRICGLAAAILAEIGLLLIALIPQSVWASHGFPNGPVPTSASSLVAGLFYVLPALTGILSRRWQAAIVFATLPAWLDLGAFAVAGAQRNGPFYLAVEPHAVSAVGTIELFAALGALGWLARPLVLGAFALLRRRSGSSV